VSETLRRHTALYLLILTGIVGCTIVSMGCREEATGQARATSSGEGGTIRLATTTSMDNSGLLDYLLPVFEKQTHIRVHVLSMGTGKALETARRGDCDVVLVHAPEAEAGFVAEGHGLRRHDVMHNDFLLIGPPDDPAGAARAGSAADAFRRVAKARAPFVSRGDESGTHKKEKQVWLSAGIVPAGSWYMQVGQGMGASLVLADQKQAYILTDRGTYLAFTRKIGLKELFSGDPALRNHYGVIAVDPARHPNVDHHGATKLIEFLTSDQGRRLIGEFRIEGKQAFDPHRAPAEAPRIRSAGHD